MLAVVIAVAAAAVYNSMYMQSTITVEPAWLFFLQFAISNNIEQYCSKQKEEKAKKK